VRRKGQDLLLEAWPRVLAEQPDAWLAVVGEGPLASTLARQREHLGAAGRRILLTGPVAWGELPAAYAALDVFAMPCRTRLAGTDVEGLGIVYLEAQASGIPAVAGRSGGAPEAVREGITGSVVDGRDARELARTLTGWLAEPEARRVAGAAGRAWTEAVWSWETIAGRFASLLDEVVAAGPR
jgi:phosphatidyl-myo-inositol dimannoside synthase